MCVYNTSKCKINAIWDATPRSTNIPSLLSEDCVQPTAAKMLLGWMWGLSWCYEVKRGTFALLDEDDRDQILYKQWVSTDRSTLETHCAPAEEFVEIFCEKLELLRTHSFIASEQAAVYKECKTTLQLGELLVNLDFSENYSFILQDAAQGFHWNNCQSTLHPFVAYFVDSGELRHLSYVIILDCLYHDTTAVYLFIKIFIAFLKSFFPKNHNLKE